MYSKVGAEFFSIAKIFLLDSVVDCRDSMPVVKILFVSAMFARLFRGPYVETCRCAIDDSALRRPGDGGRSRVRR
jgi:hypothetical protein